MTGFQRFVATLAFIVATPSWALTDAHQNSRSTSPPDQTSDSAKLLNALEMIPQWAIKLRSELRSEGLQIDQQKAKQKLLPEVQSIQKDLNDLEDLNNKVFLELNKDSADPVMLNRNLSAIRDSLISMGANISQLRYNLQTLGVRELVGLERSGELLLLTKQVAIDKMLATLGYPDPKSPVGAGPNHKLLQERSAAVTKLLHDSENAFAALNDSLST